MNCQIFQSRLHERRLSFLLPVPLSAGNLFELVAIIGIFIVTGYSLLNRSFVLIINILSASVIGYLLAYLVASWGLKMQGVGNKRVFFALAAMIASIWLFEFVYHYSFPNPNLVGDISFIAPTTDPVGGRFPLVWALIMMAIIFTGMEYMTLNKWFNMAILATILSFGIWILAGFPIFTHPEWYPTSQPLITLLSPTQVHTQTGQKMISLAGEILNSISKIPTSLILPTLFIKKGSRPRQNQRTI